MTKSSVYNLFKNPLAHQFQKRDKMFYMLSRTSKMAINWTLVLDCVQSPPKKVRICSYCLFFCNEYINCTASLGQFLEQAYLHLVPFNWYGCLVMAFISSQALHNFQRFCEYIE